MSKVQQKSQKTAHNQAEMRELGRVFWVKNQRNSMEKKGPLKESNKWLWKKNGEMVGEEERGRWVEREAL